MKKIFLFLYIISFIIVVNINADNIKKDLYYRDDIFLDNFNFFAKNGNWEGCDTFPDFIFSSEEKNLLVSKTGFFPYLAEGVPKNKINEFLNRTVAKGEGVKIAIIDNGFDIEHTDLQGQIISTCYMQQDNNVNYHGWQYKCSADVLPKIKNCLTSIGYHGTATLGIMAAKGNNGYSIVGIAPKAKYMLYKCDYLSKALASIYHAVDNGANIITTQQTFIHYDEYWVKQTKKALQYAYDHGVIVIASAGNSSSNKNKKILWTKAGKDKIFKIGAFYYNDKTENIDGYRYILENYTQYALSLFPKGLNDSSFYADFYVMAKMWMTLLPGNNYASTWSGTSFSAPAFAGFVADMLSVNPYLSYQDIKEIMNYSKFDEYLYLKISDVCNDPEIDISKLPNNLCTATGHSSNPWISQLKNTFTHPLNLYKALSLTSPEFDINIQNRILTSDIIIPPISHPADVYIWIELPNKNKYYLNYSSNKDLYLSFKESPIITNYSSHQLFKFKFMGEHGWFAPVAAKYLPKGTYKFCGRYKVDEKWLGYHYCAEFDIQ